MKKICIDRTHYGEVLQGIFPSFSLTNRCVITFPIKINNDKIMPDNDFIKYTSLYNYISYTKNKKLKINKKKFSKSFKIIKNYEKMFDKKITGSFNYHSNIPTEKGLGSSSIDLLSTLKIIEIIQKQKIPKNEIYRMCCEIEPTDPLLEKKITIFSTISGDIVHLSKLKFPPIKIFSFDTSNNKKGLSTNTVKTPKYKKNELEFFDKSFSKIKNMKKFNFKVFKDISFNSLKINQNYYPKKKFDKILEITKKIKNCLLIGAHSGTLIGVGFKSNYKLNKKDEENLKLISKLLNSKMSKFKSYE